MLSLLLASNIALGASVLEPSDTGPEDTWKSVHWCGDQRELFRVADEFWAVYEAISLKGALPTTENCKKASEDPAKVYVGLFIVRFPSSSFAAWVLGVSKDACPAGDLYIGQIDGFVSHAGSDVPFMRRVPIHFGACEK